MEALDGQTVGVGYFPFLDLPNELKINVLQYLPLIDLANARFLCKKVHILCFDLSLLGAEKFKALEQIEVMRTIFTQALVQEESILKLDPPLKKDWYTMKLFLDKRGSIVGYQGVEYKNFYRNEMDEYEQCSGVDLEKKTGCCFHLVLTWHPRFISDCPLGESGRVQRCAKAVTKIARIIYRRARPLARKNEGGVKHWRNILIDTVNYPTIQLLNSSKEK